MKTQLLVRIPSRLAPYVRAHRHLFAAGLVVLALSAWGAVGVSAWFIQDLATGLPDRASIRGVVAMDQATLLLDAEDVPAFAIFKEQRLEVPFSSISPHMVRAIVAIEDQRFFEHRGIDLVRVGGAALTNIQEGRRAQGGSTLTQQLARQSFLTPDKTVRRKLQEMIVAVRLERQFSKDEILHLYLNKVYFGDGLYGVEAASLGFFGKHASELEPTEAALLAGLVKSPSTYAPTIDPERARTRRDVVLRQMLSMGAIDRGTYETAVGTEPVLRDALRREESFGLYFKEEVRRQLVEQFGWERVYHGGLRVYTTIDPGMQKVAEAQVARALEEIQTRKGSGRDGAADEPLQAALVAMDPQTGEVRALVGGRDFHQSTFNRATQARRQPGSAFKPFVYAAALEAGYSPASIITNLNDPIPTREGDWVPEDGHYEDPEISMRVALRVSSNRAAVRMLEEVGIPAAVQYAKRLGVGSVPSVPSMALGSGEVTLLSITAGYGTFANRGLLPGPTLVRRVEEADGTLLYEWKPSAHRAISEATAFLMTTMLSDVIDRGTAWTARREGFTLPAAGKTGTTNDYYDAWFIGYTPNLVAGVWVGYDQPKTIIGEGYAAELAVPLWARFMAGATEGHPPDRFERPLTVTTARICRLTGKLAGDGCRDAVYIDEDGDVTRGSLEYVEYFEHGTEPVDECPFHAPRGLGFLATTGTATQAPTIQPGTPATLGRIPSVAAQEATSGEPESGRDPDGEREADAARQADADPEPVPERERRRGFWGRLFRR